MSEIRAGDIMNCKVIAISTSGSGDTVLTMSHPDIAGKFSVTLKKRLYEMSRCKKCGKPTPKLFRGPVLCRDCWEAHRGLREDFFGH